MKNNEKKKFLDPNIKNKSKSVEERIQLLNLMEKIYHYQQK